MAYSKSLVERIRHIVSRQRGVTEMKMFGGVCFLLNGNLLVGVWKDSLIARIGKDAYETALQKEYVTEFDVTGRPMKGWVMVEADGNRGSDRCSGRGKRATPSYCKQANRFACIGNGKD